MIGKKRSALFYIFWAVAAALSLWGLWQLNSVPDVLEYAADYAHAPQITTDDNGKKTNGILNAFEDFQENYAGEIVTVHVLNAGQALTGDQNRTDTVTIYGIGAGYFDVYYSTLLHGRYFDRDETANGAKNILLNESAAFTLFGATDAVGETVTLDGSSYTVVGVVRSRAGFLEAQAGRAYLPLPQIEADHIDLVVLSMKGQVALAAFEDAAANAFGAGGNAYSLSKEKLRARVGLRFLWIFLALTRIPAVFRFFNAITARKAEKIRELRQHYYLGRLMPRLIGMGLWCLLCYGALVGAVYLIARAGLSCAEVFTEFMPEDPTDWNSILKVARSIHGMKSTWVAYATPMVRSCQACGRLCHAGAVAFMLSWLLPAKKQAIKD